MSETKQLLWFSEDSIQYIAGEDGDLGAGGYGKVQAGFHGDRLVAIKFCPMEINYRDRIKKEMEWLHKARHKNVVEVLGWTELGNVAGIVMEYMSNKSLSFLIFDSDITLSALLRFRMCYEIAAGIAHLHNLQEKHRIVHGDIKLENILLCDQLHCKISDFGGADLAVYSEFLSKSITESSKTHPSRQYTKLYVAPELLNDPSEASRRKRCHDVYSYSMVATEIIGWKRPGFDMLRCCIEKFKLGDRINLQEHIEFVEKILKEDAGSFNVTVINALIEVIEKCRKHYSEDRCQMAEAQKMLLNCWNSCDKNQIERDVKQVTNKLPQGISSTSKNKYKLVTPKQILSQLFRMPPTSDVKRIQSAELGSSQGNLVTSSNLTQSGSKCETNTEKLQETDGPVHYEDGKHSAADSSALGHEVIHDKTLPTITVDSNATINTSHSKTPNNSNVMVAHSNVQNLCIVEHHHHHYYGENVGSQIPTEQSPTSILRTRGPRADLVPTETFNEIIQEIKDQQNVVLYLTGMPGSGKSQLARTIGEKFPFDDTENLSIKWHIQCKDKGHDVTTELEKLAKELNAHNFISEMASQTIINDFNGDGAGALVNAVLDSQATVLIIVEDLEEPSMILRNFVRILQKSQKNNAAKIHVYVTSKRRSSLFSDDEFCKIANISDNGSRKLMCINKRTSGFNQKEAVEYLCENRQSPEEKNAAKEIFKCFSGLPLGLQFVKRMCSTPPTMTYKEYLDKSSKVNFNTTLGSEEKAITDEYGKNATHPFYSIIAPLVQFENVSPDDLSLWNILACFSYLHEECLPQAVVEHFFKNLSNASDCSTESRALIQQLVDYCMCTITEEKDLSFERVALNAFTITRLTQEEKQPIGFNPLKKTIEMMCDLVSKTKKEDLPKLRRHLECLNLEAKNDSNTTREQAVSLLAAIRRVSQL